MKRMVPSYRSKKSVFDYIEKKYEGDPGCFVAAYNSTVNELLRKDIKQVKILAKKAGIIFKFLPDEFHPLLFRHPQNVFFPLFSALVRHKGLLEVVLSIVKSPAD